MAPDDPNEPEERTQELAAEVAITRDMVADDIQALGAKLAPKNLKMEAKQALLHGVEHEAQRLGRVLAAAGNALARAARRHPVPIAVTVAASVGLGVWVWRARRA